MIFYRFGEIPKNEKSCIWKGEEKVGEELGVSVYEAHKNINGVYSPVLPMTVNMRTLSEWGKALNGFITSKVKEDEVDAELPDIDSLIKKLTSDEYIEKKIKDVLGDDMAD